MALVKGQKARTNKGFQENIKTMEKAGKSKKRAVGTAYGEDYLAYDKAQKAKKAKKAASKAHKDVAADKKLVKKMVKKSCRK